MIALDAPRSTETLERVRELAPRLSRLSPQIEREHAVSPQTIALLREAGCLRMTVPRAYGGDELTLAETLAVIEALSRAEGTLAWLIGQVVLSHVVFGYLPDEALREIYADGADVYAAGAAAPKGRAVPVGGGWEISGRWPLVSGCRHAEWLYAQCLVVAPEAALDGHGGVPEMRTAVFRAGEAQILGPWRGLGLQGSGSEDILVRGYLCPASYCCDLMRDPDVPTASNRVPVAIQAGLVAAAVLIGAGHAAIEAMTELAVAKRPAFSSTALAGQAVFQDRLGEGCAALMAAHALLYDAVCAYEAQDGAEDPAADFRLRAVGPKAAALARVAIETAYDLGGSTSVIEGSPLQRRLRDVRSLSQHQAIGAEIVGRLGALAAGAL